MTPPFPAALHICNSHIEEFTEEPWEEIQKDPRGILLLWEPPIPGIRYKLGLDAAEGRTGWSRATRSDSDHKIDNSVVEVFKPNGAKELVYKEENKKKVPDIDPNTGKQRVRYRDVQVAEFAAPCDYNEIAGIAYILGSMYAHPEEEQAELILESWPGVGMLTMQELLRLNYSNLWHWEYFADAQATETPWIGWKSTERSLKLLWMRSRRHIMQGNTLIRSSFLKDEYANAEMDMVKMRAKASYGYHDDRLDRKSVV